MTLERHLVWRRIMEKAMCDVKKAAKSEIKGITEQCPTCKGKGVVPGVCTCNMEWRGTQTADGWEDCQCWPEQECSTCWGKGEIIV